MSMQSSSRFEMDMGGDSFGTANSSCSKRLGKSKTPSAASTAMHTERPPPLLSPEETSESGHGSESWDLTFSFSCGGWFQMYFFGAAHALVDTGLLQQWEAEGRRIRFVGASAGSLAAACLASGQHDFESIRDFALECAKHFRSSLRNIGCLRTYLLQSLERFGDGLRAIDTDPVMREHLSSGCLEIAVTVLPQLKSKLMSSFTSYDHIQEALLASCCMVPLVGAPFKMRSTGEWVVDGGIASFTPRMNDENVVSVSAMYFLDASVRPRTFVPSWWGVFPPSEKKYNNLFWMGYNDMVDTLVSYELLDRELGEYMLKPETDFSVHESYFDVFITLVTEIVLLLVLRPFTVMCVYIEFLISIAFYAAKTILFLDSSSAVSLYETVRNTTSLRTFVRLAFGKVVPINEARLQRSWLFRIFEPLTLGGSKRTGRECWSPSGSPTGRRATLSPSGHSPTLRRATLSPHTTRRDSARAAWPKE